jgi:hypothetical protein
MATQFAFGKIVTDGLVCSLNAADKNSYNTSGTVWIDVSGNNNNATITSATFDSNFGGSILFGQNKYATHTFTNAPFNGDFTFSVCFKHTGAYSGGNWDYLYTVNAYGTGLTITTWLDKPRINYGTWFTDVLNTSSEAALTINKNYMMTVIKKSNVFSCYVNEIAYGVGSTVASTITLSNFRIGTTPSTSYSAEYWTGNIYNINIYNKALSAAEVLQNYNAQKSRFNL